MSSPLFAYLQYALPQHAISGLAGQLANARTPWLKNFLIRKFIHAYHVDMSEAAEENPEKYQSFNEFFIRELKPGIRPVLQDTNDIACPVDGTVAQIGKIQRDQLLQAKQSYFDLSTLFGGDTTLSQQFIDGSFATLYLAPHNYHRIHMPVAGKLTHTIYVPGKLFSVNRMTSQIIPNLYARNERLICCFDTEVGPMAVILIGALIVGSMQTVWMQQPVRHKNILSEPFSSTLCLSKNAQLGYFKLGSTVIILFRKDKIDWSKSLQSEYNIKVGMSLGKMFL